jgi:hypothetical protein
LNLSGLNQLHQLSGHNFVQGDATRTYLYGGTSGIQMRSSNNATELFGMTDAGVFTFLPGGTTAATVNAFGIGIGSATPSSGTGITFPATQSASTNANTLDDYEEGTWTPTLSFAISQVGNFTYSTQTGFYTVIGNTAVIYFTIACTAIPSAGGILKMSSPFATALTTTKGFVSSVGGLTFSSRNLGAGGTQVAITDYAGVLALGILGSGRAYTDVVDVGALTSGFNISGCVIINF